MGVDHPGMAQEIQKLWRELRRVAKATLQNASIGRAGLRVYDGGWIRIEDGGLQVTGTASVSGTLTGSGTFDWTGPVNLKGAQSVTGPTTFTGQMTVNGPWELVGNGEITGDVSVTGDITLQGGGRIKAGNVEINPTEAGGSVLLGSGRRIDAASGYLGIYDGSHFIVFNSSGIALAAGGPILQVGPGGISLSALPTITSAAAGGAAPGTLWLDGSNKVHKVIPTL